MKALLVIMFMMQGNPPGQPSTLKVEFPDLATCLVDGRKMVEGLIHDGLFEAEEVKSFCIEIPEV